MNEVPAGEEEARLDAPAPSARRDDKASAERGARPASGRPRVCFYVAEHLVEAGIRFGYTNLHKEAVGAFEHDPASKVAFNICAAAGFVADRERADVLLTMWESPDLMLTDLAKLRQADVIITPSKFCFDAYRKWLDCRMHLIPLGVDSKTWAFRPREKPEKKFRILWSASPDPRKGWSFVSLLWEKKFAKHPELELYMKTSTVDESMRKIERHGNVVLDTRVLSTDELVELYASSHAMLFSSMAEGFGLISLEALASGLPLISTTYGGLADFVNHGTAWPIAQIKKRFAVYGDLPEKRSTADDGLYEVAIPDGASMYRQIRNVIENYAKAREKARRASAFVHERYSWDLFRKRLSETLAYYVAKENAR